MMRPRFRHSFFLVVALCWSLFSNISAAWDATEPLQHHCPWSSTIENRDQDRRANEEWKNRLLIHHIGMQERGDATFIRTPDWRQNGELHEGITILIDGGLSVGARLDILPTLTTPSLISKRKLDWGPEANCYGLTHLDYLILTHYDLDHHGGIPLILDVLDVKQQIFDPGDRVIGKEKQGPALDAYLKSAQAERAVGRQKKMRAIPAVGPHTIRAGGGVEITVISVNDEYWDGKQARKLKGVLESDGAATESNAVSIALKIRYGDFSYFIAGDMTGGGNGTPDVETQVGPFVNDIDVFHANHHGSATSNNEFFLSHLLPEVVVISAGFSGVNEALYHLPNFATIDRMDNQEFWQRDNKPIRNSVDYIFQTTKGESSYSTAQGTQTAPKSQNKVHDLNGDVVIMVDKDRYYVSGSQGKDLVEWKFPNKEKTKF